MAGAVIKIDKQGQKSIDMYWEYKKIVGDDDRGKLFTEAEYEAYKKKWIPIRMKNRIYIAWHNSDEDMDCKLIGPETLCFCGHRSVTILKVMTYNHSIIVFQGWVG